MSTLKPGVVSGVWDEWDGVGGPDGAIMIATGAQHDVDDAERSLRRLGLEYSPQTHYIRLTTGWVGLEDLTTGSTLYACDCIGVTDDGLVLDRSSLSYVTFAILTSVTTE